MINYRTIIPILVVAFLAVAGCAPGGEGGGSPLAFLPFVLIFVVFYFIRAGSPVGFEF